MPSQTFINRPWPSSFDFKHARYSPSRLDQVHKLARNFVASLDLGAPGVKHVKRTNTAKDSSLLTPHERYLHWRADWKEIYRGLSSLIRFLKLCRRTVRFPDLESTQIHELEYAKKNSQLANYSNSAYMNILAHEQLPRLTETAQIMLNARFNAKLASREARRLRIAEDSGIPLETKPRPNPFDSVPDWVKEKAREELRAGLEASLDDSKDLTYPELLKNLQEEEEHTMREMHG